MALNEELSGSYFRIPVCEDVNCCYCSDLARQESVFREISLGNASYENMNVSNENTKAFTENAIVDYEEDEPNNVYLGESDNGELSMDIGPQSRLTLYRRRSRGDIYDELMNKINKMIANKHGYDYIWESYIRRLKQINDTKNSTSRIACWEAGNYWIMTLNELENNISVFQSQLESKNEMNTTATKYYGQVNDGHEEQMELSKSDAIVRGGEQVVENILFYENLTTAAAHKSSDDEIKENGIDYERSAVEKASTEVYTQTLKDLKRMHVDMVKDTTATIDLLERRQSLPDTASKELDKFEKTDVNVTTYQMVKEHNSEDCEICKKFGATVITEKEEFVRSDDNSFLFEQSTTSTKEENTSTSINVDSESQEVQESVDNEIIETEVGVIEIEDILDKTQENVLTHEVNEYIRNVVNDHCKTTSTETENSSQEQGNIEVNEVADETDEISEELSQSLRSRRESSGSMQRQISYLHDMDLNKLECEWNTTMDGLRSQATEVSSEAGSQATETGSQSSLNEMHIQCEEDAECENCEEVLERLREEIREAVGLAAKESGSISTSDTQKKERDTSEASVKVLSNASSYVDLASPQMVKTPERSRRASESDLPQQKTMFETVIDKELEGDTWDTTIEDLKRECQSIDTNAPKLPGRDPRDKLRALMKIAEARWRYMTWLMAEVNPEENEKYKLMRGKTL